MNSVASLHVLDGQKLIRAYVYCYVLSCRLKINFLILSYLILWKKYVTCEKCVIFEIIGYSMSKVIQKVIILCNVK